MLMTSSVFIHSTPRRRHANDSLPLEARESNILFNDASAIATIYTAQLPLMARPRKHPEAELKRERRIPA